MIKLIVGLGNPGQQYEKTRHNAGFLFLDYLFSGSWLNESRFNGQTASMIIENTPVQLLKPMAFMNRSGQAVGNLARYHKIDFNEILVVHDELDFKAGVVKLKKGGGHAGHNGLKDIIAHLGSSDFYRLRIGIDRPSSSHQVSNYVLSEPNKIESEKICTTFSEACLCIPDIVLGDILKAMNKLNAKI
ncbi:MAG: aminoacyl-tRNA hydrolase [Methylococcaceae bacterium]